MDSHRLWTVISSISIFLKGSMSFRLLYPFWMAIICAISFVKSTSSPSTFSHEVHAMIPRESFECIDGVSKLHPEMQSLR